MIRTYIIAEAGVNHNGDINLAKEMIRKAKEAGADAVKFQTFISEELVSSNVQKAEYQKNNTGENESQLEMLKKLELPFYDFILLNNYAKEIGIDFLSTPFDFKSIDFLISLNLPYIKVPSGEITNKPYLRKISKSNIPVILSTGMSTLAEIEAALEIFKEYDKSNIILLHCTTEYPAPFEEINLKAIPAIREKFGLAVGYSDHTEGIEASIAAVVLGAVVVEKHFTLDRSMEGPDHIASIEPHEFKQMTDAIRNIEKAMGNGIKEPSKSEIKNIMVVRKSIVASRNIKVGDILDESNMTVKRPGTGISPMDWDKVVGTKAKKNYSKDEQILL